MRTQELVNKWRHISKAMEAAVGSNRDPIGVSLISIAATYAVCAEQLQEHINEQMAKHDPSLSMTDLDRVADYGVQENEIT